MEGPKSRINLQFDNEGIAPPMFTGLVEGRGIVSDLRSDGAAIELLIETPGSMGGACRIGESVAINGCCLTVVAVAGRVWSFQAGTETLSKTNLGELKPGDVVNLERPLPVDGRLGGHFVQGHVDGVGEIVSVEQDGQWISMRFRVPSSLARLLVPKGSVAIDGISLTVVEVSGNEFRVALIPHTLEVTTLGVLNVNDKVNIETDILGKYVQRLLEPEENESGREP